MKYIWVVCEGEPIPIGSYNGRLMRGGMLAKTFADLGSEVTWWTSTYLHYEKRYIAKQHEKITLSKNLELQLLHSNSGYKKNISFKRIKYSKDLAKSFRKESRLQKTPGIIYCSWPLIDFAYEAVRYGQEHHVPVVIDIRDAWPDIFIQPFPKLLQPLAKIGINLLFRRKVSYVMQNATAVVAVIPKFLKLAERYGRILQPQDRVVYLSYDSTPVSEIERRQADEFWQSKNLSASDTIVSFISTLNKRLNDFDTLIEVAEHYNGTNVKFVFCGTGNYHNQLIERTRHLDNVVIPGFRNRAELQALLKISTFGIIPIINTEDFIDALPNKFGEYLSEGLIVLTSLKGLSKQIVEQTGCGLYYADAHSLVTTIDNLKGNVQLLRTMSKNALDLYCREFDASKVYYDFYKFLESLTFDLREEGRSVDHA